MQGGTSSTVFQPKCVCVFILCVCSVASVMSDSVTLWAVAHQAPLSMGFSRKEYWSGLYFNCYIKFFFLLYIFYTVLKGMFHLELLQNIDHIPLAVQYTLEPILYPVVCSSNSFIPMLPLPAPR